MKPRKVTVTSASTKEDVRAPEDEKRSVGPENDEKDQLPRITFPIGSYLRLKLSQLFCAIGVLAKNVLKFF